MEEFSFPAIASEQNTFCKLPSPHFTSTPIWFLSSPSNHKSELHLNYQRSRSFSCLEDLKLRDEVSSTEINDEESMDMLWEDFNEELRKITCDEEAGGSNVLKLSKASDKLDGKKGNGSRELFCVKAVHHHQKPGLLMILKVFKKLLFIQKTRKKRTSSSVYHL